MTDLEKQLQETKDVRRSRAELMRRLQSGENGRKYKLDEIAQIYGCSVSYVKQELGWLKKAKHE